MAHRALERGVYGRERMIVACDGVARRRRPGWRCRIFPVGDELCYAGIDLSSTLSVKLPRGSRKIQQREAAR